MPIKNYLFLSEYVEINNKCDDPESEAIRELSCGIIMRAILDYKENYCGKISNKKTIQVKEEVYNWLFVDDDEGKVGSFAYHCEILSLKIEDVRTKILNMGSNKYIIKAFLKEIF